MLLDQVSKAWIVANLDLHQLIPVWPILSIVHAHNYGAAFGFLNHAGGLQTLFFAAVAIAVSALLLVWLRRTAQRERQLSLALAMIMGGAIGNLIDRLRLDYVVDFILVHYQGWYFPAFNVGGHGNQYRGGPVDHG